MAVSISTIKNWFRKGLRPTESQFSTTWDSFWHKDEQIPIENIDGLEETLDAKIEEALNSINQFAPTINSVTPSSALPSTTLQVTILGDFFNPNTTFDFVGQNVDLIEFISTREMRITITTSSLDLVESDIIADNGMQSTFKNEFISSVGTVMIPLANDFTNVSGDITITDGNIRSASSTAVGKARWSKLVDSANSWTLQFTLKDSGFNAANSDQLRFYDASGSLISDYITFDYNNNPSTVRINYRIPGNNFYLEHFMPRNSVFSLRVNTLGEIQFLQNGTITDTKVNRLTSDFRFNFQVGTSDFEAIRFLV